MGFSVNQYNKDDNTDVNLFMSALTDGTPIRIKEPTDMGIMGQSINPFENEGVYISTGLRSGNNYYFHGKVKRMLSDTQVFYVYLVNKDEAALGQNQQYIKTITVQSGEGWTNIEFTFSPLVDFDTIVFKLQRNAKDYIPESCRYPTIIYQELSQVNNLLDKLGLMSLYKIGVQSRPGFLMCINGEEIRTGKTGIYELKNGFVLITFFSAMAAAEEPEGIEELMNSLPEGTSEQITSTCIFRSDVVRYINNFSLDYVYENEGGNV